MLRKHSLPSESASISSKIYLILKLLYGSAISRHILKRASRQFHCTDSAVFMADRSSATIRDLPTVRCLTNTIRSIAAHFPYKFGVFTDINCNGKIEKLELSLAVKHCRWVYSELLNRRCGNTSQQSPPCRAYRFRVEQNTRPCW